MPSRTQLLTHTCHHITDAATGVRITWVPTGAYVKDILTICPECAKKEPRPKRLDSATVQRMAEEEWV